MADPDQCGVAGGCGEAKSLDKVATIFRSHRRLGSPAEKFQSRPVLIHGADFHIDPARGKYSFADAVFSQIDELWRRFLCPRDPQRPAHARQCNEMGRAGVEGRARLDEGVDDGGLHRIAADRYVGR